MRYDSSEFVFATFKFTGLKMSPTPLISNSSHSVSLAIIFDHLIRIFIHDTQCHGRKVTDRKKSCIHFTKELQLLHLSTLRNPRQTTFHAGPKSYTSNVDKFLLEMDKLHIGNNCQKL